MTPLYLTDKQLQQHCYDLHGHYLPEEQLADLRKAIDFELEVKEALKAAKATQADLADTLALTSATLAVAKLKLQLA